MVKRRIRRAGEGGEAGWGATRRRRRPPNFPPTVSWREFRHEGYGSCLATLAGADYGHQTPGHTASRSRWSPAGTRSPRRPCPPAVAASVSPSPTAPRDPSPCTSGPQAPGYCPLGAEQASRRPGKRKHGTAPPPPKNFPPFLLTQTRPGRTGPLALYLLFLLLHGAMRLGGGSREKPSPKAGEDARRRPAGGQRRKQRGGGGRGELEVFPGRVED
uniref:translation initiation factor IF-2-like n=1 Tax=Myodes glareolus TaxID=447135 RepID=UPI002020672F|nr:translation initiation factor IF-2-like [Myodes glareolus]